MWIWVLIGVVISLMACFGSTQPQPRKKTKTTIIMNGHRTIHPDDELDDWDGQDQLEELEEEEG